MLWSQRKSKGLKFCKSDPPKSPWECSSAPSEILQKIRVVSQHFGGTKIQEWKIQTISGSFWFKKFVIQNSQILLELLLHNEVKGII